MTPELAAEVAAAEACTCIDANLPAAAGCPSCRPVLGRAARRLREETRRKAGRALDELLADDGV